MARGVVEIEGDRGSGRFMERPRCYSRERLTTSPCFAEAAGRGFLSLNGSERLV